MISLVFSLAAKLNPRAGADATDPDTGSPDVHAAVEAPSWNPVSDDDVPPGYNVHSKIQLSLSITHTHITALTLSIPSVSNGYTSKCSAPYWSNPPFLIF